MNKLGLVLLIISIVFVVLFLCLWTCRRQIQGSWFDGKAILTRNDLSNETVLITGGNGGIGYAVAIEFVKLNANVIIACRNETKARNAVKSIKDLTKSDNISYLILDLNDLETVKAMVNDINQKGINIDFLICNAGGGYDGEVDWTTQQNLQPTFQCNYFGHWYLTQLLLDNLKKTADIKYEKYKSIYGSPVRVITVSSGAHSAAQVKLDSDKDFNELSTKKCDYGQAKLLTILHARGLQKRIENDGYKDKIQSICLRPGMVRSGAFSKLIKGTCGMCCYICLLPLTPIYIFISKSLKMATQNYLHCCCYDKIIINGFYANCYLETPNGRTNQATNEQDSQKLWEKSVKLLNSIGF